MKLTFTWMSLLLLAGIPVQAQSSDPLVTYSTAIAAVPWSNGNKEITGATLQNLFALSSAALHAACINESGYDCSNATVTGVPGTSGAVPLLTLLTNATNANNLISGTVGVSRLPTIPFTSLQAIGADTVVGNFSAVSGVPTTNSLPNCATALSYSTSTHLFGCTASGGGTVTSVGLSLPAIFSVINSPVTSSGVITASLANQSPNLVFSGPATGTAAPPSFRALVAADIPQIPISTGVSGLGTGVATALAATPTGTGSIVLASGPSITLGNATGLPVATGLSGAGTGVTAALGNAVNATGGLITYAVTSLPSLVLTTSNLPAISADSVLLNATGASASPTGQAIGNCSNALTYSTSTHAFGCNTSAGTGTVTSITAGTGLTGGTITASGTIAAGPLVQPGGRLTLASHTPVMTTSQTAKSTLYYDSYVSKWVPIYNGTSDALDAITSNEMSVTLEASGTGLESANNVFDVWFYDNSGSPVVCIATNGSGAGWSGDTGGSNTARGTGYTALDNFSRSFITNKNAIANCYNATTNYGSIAANKATYLGTIMTDSATAGSVSFTYGGSAAGGSAAWFGVWNNYNRVSIATTVRDANSSWSYTTASFRSADNSNNNRVSFVIGNQEDAINVFYSDSAFSASVSTANIGVGLNTTTSATGYAAAIGINGTGGQGVSADAQTLSTAPLGQNFYQAVESGGTGTSFQGGTNFNLSFQSRM